jgi:hypothetical protein
MNVRPVGYYGELLAPKPKKDRQKRARTETEYEQTQSLATRIIACLAKIDGITRGEYLDNVLRREAFARGNEIRNVDPDLADELGL